MNFPSSAPIDVAELQRLITAVEPAALLVPPRLVRRVIKQDRDLAGLGLQVPHRRSHVLSRERLLQFVREKELGLPPGFELPPVVVLLARPHPRTLEATSREATLEKYWRILFHARVHAFLERALAEQLVTVEGIRDRLQKLGRLQVEEVRAVLDIDEYLLPPGDDRTLYIEFAALFWELRFFAPTLLPYYFPAIDDLNQVQQLLSQDLDAAGLFEASRLAGTPDPVPVEDRAREEATETERLPKGKMTATPSGRHFLRWRQRADKAAGPGNVVSAALSLVRASAYAPVGQKTAARNRALGELTRLAARFQPALPFPANDLEKWQRALLPLLKPAAQGFWPVEARLLYDLQKVCVDHERELYAVDFVEWVVTLGRRPVKRPLPWQRRVLQVKYLRSAARRLRSARVSERDRHRLAELLLPAVEAAEERLRDHLRPILAHTLERVGMASRNLPEQTAFRKLGEELLDRVIERGYLNMGDLRDAISRNDLKLPDLAGPRQLFLGDWIIRANRRLAVALEGVYHRGEIYLRWLQRFSSAAFGTHTGRFLTRYLVLPFGSAFATIVMVEEVQRLPGMLRGEGSHEQKLEVDWATLGWLGALYFLLLHSPVVRRGLVGGLRAIGFGLRVLFVDWPRALARLPLVRRILDSKPVQIFAGTVLKPALYTLATGVVLRACGLPPRNTGIACAGVFLVTSILYDTRLLRNLEESVTDWLVRTWQVLQFNLLPGLFRLVMGVFKRLSETVDRFLYRVDEWLRFRSGDSRVSLLTKPVLGLGWFVISYVVRIYVNLFIEPTVNPIKHFPAVTVAAKVLVPFSFVLVDFFRDQFAFLGPAVARPLAWLHFVMLPGVFGFLVWELRENWRLYEANRSPVLGPVPVGHHGETVLRLLKVGLHSGTVPKLFTKLRRAQRHALRWGDWRPARKQLQALHQVEESLWHFADRDWAFLLDHSRDWQAGAITVAAVDLATHRIRYFLGCPALGGPPLELDLELHPHGLEARVRLPGWLSVLSADQRRWAELALAGFFRKAGVDWVPGPGGEPASPQAPITWDHWVRQWNEGKRI